MVLVFCLPPRLGFCLLQFLSLSRSVTHGFTLPLCLLPVPLVFSPQPLVHMGLPATTTSLATASPGGVAGLVVYTVNCYSESYN
jgi:hypothetical protein